VVLHLQASTIGKCMMSKASLVTLCRYCSTSLEIDMNLLRVSQHTTTDETALTRVHQMTASKEQVPAGIIKRCVHASLLFKADLSRVHTT